MVRSHQRPLIMQSIEQIREYTPKQKFFREMRDTLSTVYQTELLCRSAQWEATKTVDMIASYYEQYVPIKVQERIHLNTEKEPAYFKLRTIALAVGLRQQEMLGEMKKGKLIKKSFFNETILNEDHLLVLEAVLLIDQHHPRA